MRPPVPKIKAPGPGLPAAAVWRHLEEEHENGVRAYRRKLAACRHRLSRHAVHQLRVAIRRLLAGLELLRAVQRDRPAVRGLLQGQLKVLGALHDTQIQLQRVEHEARSARVLTPLRQHLRKRRDRREKAARKALQSDKVAHRLERWRLLAAPPRLISRLRRLMDEKLGRAFDPLAGFTPDSPADAAARHRVRVISRQYRYMVETLRPGWQGGENGRLIANLQAYQDIIGQIHDRELLLHRIDSLVIDEKLDPAPIRPFRARLRNEMMKLLKACAQLDRWMFQEAMLARRHLHENLPCH